MCHGLFNNDDDVVESELQYWLKTKEGHKHQDMKDTSWQRRHQEEYAKMGLRWGAPPAARQRE